MTNRRDRDLGVQYYPSEQIGDLSYRDRISWRRLPIGAANTVLRVASGLPGWGTVASLLATVLTTKGDILVHNGSTAVRLPVGADDEVLTADAAQTEGVKWADVGGGATTAVKAADETVNNLAALQDDDDLLLAVGANETWAFELFLKVDTPVNRDFKLALTGPTGATGAYDASVIHDSSDPTVSATTESEAAHTLGNALEFAGDVVMTVRIVGVIVNGANTGNLQLQWAQATAGATDTTVKAGSWLMAHQLA